MPSKIVSQNDPRVQQYKGKRFGNLTAVDFLRTGARGQWWNFRCDCGNFTIAPLAGVKFGQYNSCGCLQRVRKHGFCSDLKCHPIYRVWLQMRQRCSNRKNKGWENYGGRGIRVCERWEKFENFAADMLPDYQNGLSIDRVNNDGPYSPENCKWSNREEQNTNCRRNVFITFHGLIMTISEWSKALGIPHNTISYRFKKGMPTMDVLRGIGSSKSA